jgi:hypothetical protein
MTQGKKMKMVRVGIVGAGARGRTGVGTLGTRVVDADLALSRSERGVRFSSDFTIRFRDAYTRQMLAWIRSVHDGRTVGASAVDGLRTTLVAEPGERPCSLPAGRRWKIDGEPPLGAACSKVARYGKVTITLDEIVQRLHERLGGQGHRRRRRSLYENGEMKPRPGQSRIAVALDLRAVAMPWLRRVCRFASRDTLA